MTRKKLLPILFLSLVLLNGQASAFFGVSGPNPNLDKINTIRTEILTSTAEIWNSIDSEVEKLLNEHRYILNLTADKANALTLNQIMARMEARLAWSKKFNELRDFLSHEYKQIRVKIEASDLPPPFKEETLKHYDQKFSGTAKKTMLKYLESMGKVNETLFETYKIIGGQRFPSGKESKKPEELTENQIKSLKEAITPQTLEKIKRERREYFVFESTFHFNPVEDNVIYRAATAIFKRDPERQKKLQDKFISAYFTDGVAKAEFSLKNQVIPILNTELPQSLPKASGEAIAKFSKANLSVLEKFYSSNTGADTKFCLLFADTKEFVGIDYNQILYFYFTKDAPWNEEFFQAANDVLESAQKTPGAFTLKEKEVEDLLKLGKNSAAVSVSKNEWFEKLLEKNKFSPRRFCFLRHALIEELLKLPSPAREDTLRLIYTKEAAAKPISQPAEKK